MPDENSMIKDLREIEKELREQKEYRKANIIDLFIRYSTYCKISKREIKELTIEMHKDGSHYWANRLEERIKR